MRCLPPLLVAALAVAGECQITPLAGHAADVQAVVDAGDGLVATCDGAVRLWDAGSGRLRWLQAGEPMRTGHPPEITRPAILVAAGGRIVAGWSEQTEILDRASGRVLARAPLALGATTPDATWLVATGGGRVSLHPIDDPARAVLSAETGSFAAQAACAADGRTVWACGVFHGRLLRLARDGAGWRVADAWPAPADSVDALAAVRLAGGGEALAVAAEASGSVRIAIHALPYDPAAAPLVSATLPTYGSEFRIVLRQPAPGRLLAWARGGEGVSDIDLASGTATVRAKDAQIGCAALVDGALAVGSGHEVRIQGADGAERCVLSGAGRTAAVAAMLRSPDGRLLWTSSEAGVACWDLAILRLRSAVVAPATAALRATPNPGVGLWGTEADWRLVALDGRGDLAGVAAGAAAVPAFAADGGLAATVADGALHTWRLPDGKALGSAALPAWEQDTIATWLGVAGDGRRLLVMRRGEREVVINGGRETAPPKCELRVFALPGLEPGAVAVLPLPQGLDAGPDAPPLIADGDGWAIVASGHRLRVGPDAAVRGTEDGAAPAPDRAVVASVAAASGPWFARLAAAVDGLGFVAVTAPGGDAVRLVADGDAWAAWSDDGAFDGSRSAGRLLAAVLDGRSAALDEAAPFANRPDRLLRRLGCDDAELLAAAARPADRRQVPAGERPSIGVRARRNAGGRLLLDLAAPGAARLEAWLDGVAVPALVPDGSPAVPDAAGAATVAAPIAAGASRFEVAAVDAAGRRSVRILETMPAVRGAPGRVVAACLGVSRYREPSLALRFAAKDALDLALAFGDAGARHLARAWVDDQVVAARLDEVRAHLAQAGPDDTVVLTLAGHGLYAGEPRPAWVFLPWDGDPARPAETGIAWGRIAALLDGCPARKRLIVLDACESGDLDETVPTGSGLAVPGARGFRAAAPAAAAGGLAGEFRASDRARFVTADLALGSGAVVLASSRGGESSYESEPDRNGLFTAALLAGLRGAADGCGTADAAKDGCVSADELVRWTAQEVARRSGGRQRPTIDRDNPAAAILLPVLPPAE